jgi:hypothetical protein
MGVFIAMLRYCGFSGRLRGFWSAWVPGKEDTRINFAKLVTQEFFSFQNL